MFTPEQAQALKEFKTILEKYNTGQITYTEYVEKTLPLWDKINILFNKQNH